MSIPMSKLWWNYVHKGMTLEKAKEAIKIPYFGCMMVKLGDADGMKPQ